MIVSVLSPGRFNIIGEHTDHQGGLVLPGCIQQGIILHGKRTDDRRITIHSDTFGETDIFDIDDFNLGNGWRKYTRGVIKKFGEDYTLTGLKIWIESDMSISGGLSSSAALEVGLFYLLQNIYDLEISAMDLVKKAHFVENKFVGVNCGIMDQTIVRLGKKGNALKLNCDTLEYEYIPINPEITFLLINTNIERDLSTSEYNYRIEELEKAFEKIVLLDEFKDINNISKLEIDHLHLIEPHLDILEFNRVKHVITENDRVIRYSELMSQNRFEEAGKLLYQSHHSLRDNFEVSWSEADRLIQLFESEFDDIIHGARMIGAGWGGSVLIQLLSSDKNKLCDEFDILEVNVSDGVTVIECEIRDDIHLFFNY